MTVHDAADAAVVRAAVAVARVAQQARQVRALHTQKSFLRNLPPTGSCGATLTAAGALAVHGHCGLRIALPRMPARARRAGEPFSAVSWPCWGPFWGPCLTVYIFIDRLGINGTLHRSPHRLLYRACRASQAVTVAAPFVVSVLGLCRRMRSRTQRLQAIKTSPSTKFCPRPCIADAGLPSSGDECHTGCARLFLA